MLERLLSTVIILTLTFAGADVARSAPPAAAPADEVRLKSGGFVRGDIVEYMPGEYVIIEPAGQGEARRFEWSEVDEVIRGDEIGTASPGVPAGVPGGTATDTPDAEAPTPSPTIAEAGPAPSPETPAIRVEQVKGKNPAVLYRVEGEGFGQGGGLTIHTLHYSELCEAPCDFTLDRRGEFFVGGQGNSGSKRFRLPGNHSAYTLRVKARPKGLIWGGVAAMSVGLVGGTLLIVVPLLATTLNSIDDDVPAEQPLEQPKTGFFVGAAVVYAAGLAGGITLFAFSRSKVEVLPGR